MHTQTESNKTNTISLNFVKFFGACIVAFVWHYQHFEPLDGNPFESVFTYSYLYGWLMVELFFMLSGFGMMLGYGSKVLNHEISFAKYIKKRLEKVYPLFLTSLVLVVILQSVFSAKTGTTFVYDNTDLFHLFLNIVLCHSGLFVTDLSFNGPSWSISICLILYVVFFIVLNYSTNIKSAVCKFALLGLLGCMLLNMDWNYPILNSLVARGIFCFSIGVGLAYFHLNEHLFNTRFIGYVCLISLFVCYVAYFATPSFVDEPHLLFILFIAPMIILCTLYVPLINRILSMRLFTYLGSISMEIYLFHFVVQCIIKLIDIYANLELNYSSKTVWAIYVASTISISILYKQLFSEKFKALFVKSFEHLILKSHE